MKKLLLLSLLYSFAHANPIYRWRDAQGQIHYDDTIPANTKYEQVSDNDLPPAHSMVPTKPTPQSAKKSDEKIKKLKVRRQSTSVDAALTRCRRYEEQLENIANRLRGGYREPTGNRLRAKRRQLEQRKRDEC